MPVEIEIRKLGEITATRKVERIFADFYDGRSQFVSTRYMAKWIAELCDLDGDWCEQNSRWYASLTTLLEFERRHKTASGRRLRQITVTMESNDVG